MAAPVSQNVCFRCKESFPETAAYFRPRKNAKGGYFEGYCRNCEKIRDRARQRKQRPPTTERWCKSALGCQRLLLESDFSKGQGICKSCYNAHWVPRQREKRRLMNELLRAFQRGSLIYVHGVGHCGEGAFSRDSEPLATGTGHSVTTQDAVHKGLQPALAGKDGHDLHAEVVSPREFSCSRVWAPAPA